MNLINVTTWSARKRHLMDPEGPSGNALGEPATLCNQWAKKPGQGTARNRLSQEQIDELEPCLKCERKR